MSETIILKATRILQPYEQALGENLEGYRNHVQRVIQYCLAMKTLSHDDQQKICIAACFHDLGIWTAGTFDYLRPSIQLAHQYLQDNTLQDWEDEIVLMIDMHHKLTPYRDRKKTLVEIFRRADLIDLSLGLVKFGLPGDVVRSARKRFPNNGFHRCLSGLVLRSFIQHPLRPLPMYKW